jgi:hypothetical protein
MTSKVTFTFMFLLSQMSLKYTYGLMVLPWHLLLLHGFWGQESGVELCRAYTDVEL